MAQREITKCEPLNVHIAAISLVVPCYNEQEVLPITIPKLIDLLLELSQKGKIATSSRVVLIDDGSRDETWKIIEARASASPQVTGIKLSRNRGHQNALLAGLWNAPGDALISIDADLQDDLVAVEQMIDAFLSGADIVYGVRRSRSTDTPMKRLSAEWYYRVLHLMGVEVVFNHADYRLLSRRAVEALREFREVNLFLRGVIPLLGFPSSIVYYDRKERAAGASKYPLNKMIGLAWQGITSFSAMPLRFITAIGFGVFVGSLLVSGWALAVRLFTDRVVPGWASTVVPMYLLGGIQLLGIGVIGEYLAKIYMETKARPQYFVEKLAGAEQIERGRPGGRANGSFRS